VFLTKIQRGRFGLEYINPWSLNRRDDIMNVGRKKQDS